jgi:hypothetical protein
MPSITSWTRLEPRTQREDLQDSLAARLHDPLWQLARQWQIGELTAEDAGSPVEVRVRIEHAPLTRYRAGAGTTGNAPGVPFDAARTPLEALVEREPVLAAAGTAPNARMASVAGLHFLRFLAQHGVGQYRDAYVARYALVTPANDDRVDAAARRFLAVMGGRVPDGVRLRADLAAALGRPTPALPAEPVIAEADRAAVSAAARAWLAWYSTHASEPEGVAPAWQPERMEYTFALAAPAASGETVLIAPEYSEGRLDWQAFDYQAGASLGASADGSRLRTVTRTLIPTPVSYRGMPAARWWEFEEAEVNFGQIDAGPTDLLRLLLLGFALDFGNDWFVAPVELDVGSINRVRSLVVTDSFGERTLIRSAAQVDAPRRDWRLFCPEPVAAPPSGADGAAATLLLAPTLASTLNGEAIEEVLFLRDELANLAWAVERVVESATGGRLDRLEAYRTTRLVPPPAPSGDGNGMLHYRLATTVPDYWLPLVPVRIDPARPDIRLRRGRVLLDRDGQPTTPGALGRVLEPGTPLSLFEEEVPRAGARLTRAWQYARWMDGTTHLWIGRRNGPGRGEGWSGLRFDVVEPL